MKETRYHNDKIYIPREVKEKMGLRNGDRVTIEITNETPLNK
ncbi:AbrB/MazE/SpoVT family DNA-binding domain-containing protein [Candidatus Bathyarchaeota archaeon]|nr:AbrB/MazE/SpoVT family DNA-binding domain-containing protein [Candidatus Bathyarchaeota archaeon]